jgi:hypothetical protein
MHRLHAGADMLAPVCACCKMQCSDNREKESNDDIPPYLPTVRRIQPEIWRHYSEIARHVGAVSLLPCASSKARAPLRGH